MTQINFIATPVQKPIENVQGEARLSQTRMVPAEQFSSQTGSATSKSSEDDFYLKDTETLEAGEEAFSFDEVFKLEDKTAHQPQQFTQFLQKNTLLLKVDIVPNGQENLSKNAKVEASPPDGRLGAGDEMLDQPTYVGARPDSAQNFAPKVTVYSSPEQTSASTTINQRTGRSEMIADNTASVGTDRGAITLKTGLSASVVLDSPNSLEQSKRPPQNTTFSGFKSLEDAHNNTSIHSALSTSSYNIDQGPQPETASVSSSAQKTLEAIGLQNLTAQPLSRQVSLEQGHHTTPAQSHQLGILDVPELTSQSRDLTLRNENTAPNPNNTILPLLVKPEGEVVKVQTSQYAEITAKPRIPTTNVVGLSQNSAKPSASPLEPAAGSTSIPPTIIDRKSQKPEPNTTLGGGSFSKTETQTNAQKSLIATATSQGAALMLNDGSNQLLQTNLELVSEEASLKSEFVALETQRPLKNNPAAPVYQNSAQSDIARSIAQQLAAASNGDANKPIELALSPEELGRVKLTFSPNENGMSVSILAERPETLELMRKNIDSLAQEFLGIGYDQITFAFNQSNTGQNQSGEQNQKSDSPQTNDLGHPENEPDIPVTINLMQSDRVDIRI